MKKILGIILACVCIYALSMCGDADGNNNSEEAGFSIDYAQETEASNFDEKITQEETTEFDKTVTESETSEPESSAMYENTPEPENTIPPTASLEPENQASQEESTKQEISTAQTSTPVPTREPVSTKEPVPAYTYTDLNKIMYAKQTVNVRDIPTTDGKKLGTLSTAQEVTVTGQCRETNWYRISYNGNIAYVSNKYLDSEKPVAETTRPASSPTANNNSGGSASQDKQTPTESQGGSSSVTVPKAEETGDNLVWIPVNGGTKYHSRSSCSKMKDPIQVSIDTAIANGYEPCKKCY